MQNDEEVYTDRNLKQLFLNQKASFRMKGKWFNGIIKKLNTLSGEQYAYVTLDNETRIRVFHSSDIDGQAK